MLPKSIQGNPFFTFFVYNPEIGEHFFEFFLRHSQLCINPRTLVVNGFYGIVQEFGNAGTVGDTESDEGENSQFGIEFSRVFHLYAAFRFQHRVYVFDKSREDVEEGRIEAVIHMFQLIVGYIPGRIGKFYHIVRIAPPEAGVHTAAERYEAVDIG